MKNILMAITCLFLTVSISHGQQKSDKKKLKESIEVKFKEGAKPTVYVDGKKFDFPIDLIDPNQIESVSVVKGKAAMKKFNAPNGVVLVVTKKAAKLETTKGVFVKIRENEVFSNSKDPLVIIDGKVSNQKTLKKLNTKNIEKIDVIKGEAAKKQYNAKNGVILITTKKKNKK